MNIPRHHQSAVNVWPTSVITSGAKYSGVPAIVLAYYPFYTILASP